MKSDDGRSASEERNLRTGRTIWQEHRRPPVPTLPLPSRSRCDVAVIGAGISGALIAEALTEAGLDVMILDRRGIAEGSTPASTALLQYELDTPLSQMAERIGWERAMRIWRRSYLAVEALRARTERLGLEVGAATRPSLYLDGNLLDPAQLAAEADARRRAGFEVELIGPTETERRYGIRRRHAIVGFGNYSADPRAMAAAYLGVAAKRGARIHPHSEIVRVDAAQKGVTLESDRGAHVQARHAVFATGYEMMKGVPRLGNHIMSTWVIATRPQPEALWRDGAMIWEASDPYLYIRTTPEGAVICGGEDEEIASAGERDAKLAAKTKILTRKLAALLPAIDPAPAFAWAGSFGNSPLGTPTVGRVPRMPKCYSAMGYGGNGITFSMMAAQILRSEICGARDPDSDLFGFRQIF